MQKHLGVNVTAAQEPTINYGQWVQSQGQKIETLYATEARSGGALVVDIDAVYHEPATLACLPLNIPPHSTYTFSGWVTRCLEQEK